MKAICLLFLSAMAVMPVVAQDSSDANVRRQCKDIAVKLYPDLLSQNSDLLVLFGKMERVLKMRDSGLQELPEEPLVVAAAAANILKIQPNWSALNDSEKETAYYSMVDAMDFTTDLTVPKEAISQQTPQPSPNTLDPGPLADNTNASNHHGMDDLIPSAQDSSPTPLAPVDPSSLSQPPGLAAYHCYLFQTVVSQPEGSYGGRNDVLTSGPWAGLTTDEATAKAQVAWTQLPDAQKLAYEKIAEQTGDPIIQKREDDAAKPTQIIPGPIIEN